MKKLTILLLLSTSLSTFGLSIAPLVPCDGNPNEKERLLMTKFHEEVRLQHLHQAVISSSISDKENANLKELIIAINSNLEVLDEEILKLTGNCKQSPEGQFINGNRDGEWIWWDKYNRKIKAGNYVNGSKEGPWFERLYAGHAYDTIEMYYKDDKLEGKWTHWYSYEGPYEDFQKQEEKHFLENEIKYLISEKDRIRKEQYEVGEHKLPLWEEEFQKLEEKYKYLIEIIEGIETQLHKLELEMPKIIAEGYYIKGVKEGAWTLRYRNSNKRTEGSFINGDKDGTWTYWYSFGEVYKEEIYEDGILIEKKFL